VVLGRWADIGAAVAFWVSRPARLFTVIVWRDQAEHVAESVSKGSRVVVVGRLQQRSWTTGDGSAWSTVGVVAEELGQAWGGRRRPDQDHAQPGPGASPTSGADGAGPGRGIPRVPLGAVAGR
jgi:single-strand DNA-binding protein